MNYKQITKDTVEEIVNSEQKRYNIEINSYTPTILEYMTKKLNIKKNSFKDNIYVLLDCLESKGISNNKDIFVFNKNYYGEGLSHLPKTITKDKQKVQELIVSDITYHEIRHILQYKRKDLYSEEELFFIHELSNANTLSIYNREYYNNLYTEIDAEIYTSLNCIERFKNDEEIKKYFTKKLNYYEYKKNNYNFEENFQIFCESFKNNKYRRYSNFLKIFFNENGLFKSLEEIITNKNFKISPLSTKILTSNAFIDSIDIEDLTEDEKRFLISEIDYRIELINQKKEINNDQYNSNKIEQYYYQDSRITFDELIESKEKVKEKLLKNKVRKL